jgi:hypothetical protein
MYYRIMTSPPGYGSDEKYMVGVYATLDKLSKTCNLKKSNGRPLSATLEEARSMLPSTAQQIPFKPQFQFLELWQDGEEEKADATVL